MKSSVSKQMEYLAYEDLEKVYTGIWDTKMYEN